MTDLTFNISIELTASQIIRSRASTIDAGPATENAKSEATQLAQEVHAILAEVRARLGRYWIGASCNDAGDYVDAAREATDDECAFTRDDLLDAVRRTLLGFWSTNRGAAVAENDWVEEQLRSIDDALFARYLQLCDRIQGTNYAESDDYSSLTH